LPKKASEEPREKTEKKEPPKKKKKMLILLLVLVVLAGSAAAAYFYFKKPAGEAAPVKKSAAAELENFEMGEMVVNLAGNGGGHYLKVKITVEYPKDKKLAEELKRKKYLLSDALITALRAKTLTEVSSADSAAKLKSDLMSEINSRLDSGKVVGVYFTDFLVQ